MDIAYLAIDADLRGSGRLHFPCQYNVSLFAARRRFTQIDATCSKPLMKLYAESLRRAIFHDIVKGMKLILPILMIAVFGAAIFLFSMPKTVMIASPVLLGNSSSSVPASTGVLPTLPEASLPASTATTRVGSTPSGDIPNQQQLLNPPAVAKGIYVTGWVAGSRTRMQALIDLVKRTELNSVVVDIKDYSGYVSYHTGIPEVAAAGAENEIRIVRPNALIKELHDNGIYVIGRVTNFQDPILAKAHPEWALKNKLTGKVWTDNKGLAWMDPAAPPVRKYLLSIVQDAFARGFDEIQFDYIRFASDGALGNIDYPYWDQKTPRAAVIADYFKFLRVNLPGKKISADLFGLATVDTWDDMGIGQVLEDAYKYFDYVSPMVYPSHYAAGTLGYKNPGLYPYEIIRYSMDRALDRLVAYNKKLMTNSSTIYTTTTLTVPLSSVSGQMSGAKLRPWLQDFNLGATYDAPMIRKQIQATDDSLLNVTGTRQGYYGGWLLWSAANTYTTGALKPE
ncbi:MAG: putative glycoside hydrolase [Candidatus Liptonbacteria bacterium]|nr:putative glycoside hydrolase [Candidatus Liptonbacteria bacterium]